MHREWALGCVGATLLAYGAVHWTAAGPTDPNPIVL